VTSIAAPLFVALAEEGLDTGPIADSITAHYLTPLFAPHSSSAIPDTLVLGCTHFPMLRAAIRGVVGSEVNIVDSAQTTAAAVADCLRERHLEAAASQSVAWQANGRVRYLATDSAERFARIGSRFLQLDIAPEEVGLIDLQSGSA
jgi:glutamate racemase